MINDPSLGRHENGKYYAGGAASVFVGNDFNDLLNHISVSDYSKYIMPAGELNELEICQVLAVLQDKAKPVTPINQIFDRVNEAQVAADQVNHPAHYGSKDNPYEVIKVMEAWLTVEEFIGAMKFNIHKYNARAKKKGIELENYEKAAFYQVYLVDYCKRHDIGVKF